MKKIPKVILAISIIIVTISIIAICFFKDYSVGKDTLAQFDNGRYQILRTSQKSIFYDMKKNTSIEADICRYFVLKPNIYIVGEQGYTILNYKTDKIKQSKDLNSFSSQEIEVFKDDIKFNHL